MIKSAFNQKIQSKFIAGLNGSRFNQKIQKKFENWLNSIKKWLISMKNSTKFQHFNQKKIENTWIFRHYVYFPIVNFNSGERCLGNRHPLGLGSPIHSSGVAVWLPKTRHFYIWDAVMSDMVYSGNMHRGRPNFNHSWSNLIKNSPIFIKNLT